MNDSAPASGNRESTPEPLPSGPPHPIPSAERIPLGNGALGVLLWGETNLLRLSLDRGDLWDECPAKPHVAVKDRFHWSAMQRMVAENRMDEFNEVFDSNYDYDGPPNKLPAGRVRDHPRSGATAPVVRTQPRHRRGHRLRRVRGLETCRQ